MGCGDRVSFDRAEERDPQGRSMSRATYEAMLREGKPNSLGRTEEVTRLVLADRRNIRSLYACYRSDDEWVRLRVSSTFKRVFHQRPQWFDAWIDRFIDEVAVIDQPSAQWTFCLLMERHAARLDTGQTRRAKRKVKNILENTEDWIVENNAMQALGLWAVDDARLRTWLRPRLEARIDDRRKSVAGRAKRLLARLPS